MKIYVTLMCLDKYWDNTEVLGAGVSMDAAKQVAQNSTEYSIDWQVDAIIHPDNLHAYGVNQNGIHYAIVETELAE